MTKLEKTFEYAKNTVRLSDAEKSSTRAELLTLMQERPVRAPVRSPLSALMFSPMLRYAIAFLLFIGVGGTGIAYAANDASSPSDALYIVKVKVTEPVQVALTFDPKDRADLEVKLVSERLKEVAEASVDSTLTPDQVSLVSDSLSTQIDNAQKDISTITEAQPDDALQTATDLATTLATHAAILQKVQEANPEASSTIASVVSTVSDELSQTTDIVDTTQTAVVSDIATSTLATPTDQQAGDTATALAQVKQEVKTAFANFDASDRQDVNDALAEIQSTIADAEAKDAAGDTKSAYLLYTEADQKLTALRLTVEADQTLHIDVIDASTTDITLDDASTSAAE